MSGTRDTPDASTSADTREKAARLFAYLRELAKLRLSMVRDCRDYEEIVWFHEIPMEPELREHRAIASAGRERAVA